MNRRRAWRAAVALVALPMGACSTGTSDGTDPVIESALVNQTRVTVRASLHAGERVRLRGAPITPIKDGGAVEVVPGQTAPVRLSRPRAWGIGPRESTDDLVFWLRCEVITPSWESDRVRWLEFLGPPAAIVTLKASGNAQGVDLSATSNGAPLEPVDPSMHPFRDRNRAFAGATETTR